MMSGHRIIGASDLGPEAGLLGLALVVVVMVTILSGLAWLIRRPLASQAALRRLILLCALIGCLAAPGLVWLCEAAGVTWLLIPLLGQEQVSLTAAVAHQAADPASLPTFETADPTNRLGRFPAAETQPFSPTEADPAGQAAKENRRVDLTTAQRVERIDRARRGLSWRWLVAGALVVWAVGTALMLVRFARNCWHVLRLRGTARPAQDQRLCAQWQHAVAPFATRRVPLLLVSQQTVTPLAVGFGRPAIVMPERLLPAISDQQLRDVLTHESAHLARGDHRIVLLAELAGALYWPIVSVHAMNRELRRACEEICDNVVLAQRDALGYGETLLHMAELLLAARRLPAAVGILGGRGELERRVIGLIDPRRDRRTTVRRRMACLVVLLCAVVGGLASATRFAVSAPAILASDKPTPAAATPEREGSHPLRGTVLGPRNRPIAGARLYLSVDEWTDPIELGTSGASGEYRFEVPAKTLRRTVTSSNELAKCQAALIAIADGLGPAWVELPAEKGGRYGPMKAEYVQNLHLGEDFRISGRVLDAHGRPAAGAVVVVQAMHELADGRWHKMPAAIEANDPERMTRDETDTNNWFTPLYPNAWRVLPAASVDAEGRFNLAGVGANRAVKLGVSGPGIRNTTFSVLTRNDVDDFTRKVREKYPHTLREPHGYFYPERKGHITGKLGVRLFGPGPTIEVDPARTISGVVREADTGEPIAGMRITTADSFGAGRATTDQRGRYRIVRTEDNASISVYSDIYQEDKYLTVVQKLTNAQSLGERTLDFEIPRGVMVEGRVVEAGTNRPIVSGHRQGCHDTVPGPLIAGTVTYYPLSHNTALRGSPTGLYFEGFPAGSQNYSRSVTIDGQGRFRLVVPPGPGVLLASAQPGFPMMGAGVVAESAGMHRKFPYASLSKRNPNDGAPLVDLESFAGFVGKVPTYPLSHFHAYQVIDPPAHAGNLEIKFEFRRAASRVVRFVDPAGDPISGVRVTGLITAGFGMSVILDDAEVEVEGLEPGSPRKLEVYSGDNRLVARATVSGETTVPQTIQLEAAGTIVGRVVDRNGKPLSGLISPTQHKPDDVDPERGYLPQTRSDAEGRFRIGPLLPRLRYSGDLRGGSDKRTPSGTLFEKVQLAPGEVRDLGEIRLEVEAAAEPGTAPDR